MALSWSYKLAQVYISYLKVYDRCLLTYNTANLVDLVESNMLPVTSSNDKMFIPVKYSALLTLRYALQIKFFSI